VLSQPYAQHKIASTFSLPTLNTKHAAKYERFIFTPHHPELDKARKYCTHSKLNIRFVAKFPEASTHQGVRFLFPLSAHNKGVDKTETT